MTIPLVEGLKGFVANDIPEVKAAGMEVKKVRAFTEVSYDQATDTRICTAEAELANAQIIDLKITLALNPETGGYIPKIEYAPR